MTRNEIATEFAELWREFTPEAINSLLAGNVPVAMLEFFVQHSRDFARQVDLSKPDTDGSQQEQLPNLLILGYLIRVLEERLA